MDRLREIRSPGWLLLFLGAALLVSEGAATAQEGLAVPAVATEYMQVAASSYDDWCYLRLDEAQEKANRVVSASDAEAAARVKAYQTLVLVYLSRDEVGKARRAVAKMLEEDPAARFSPEGYFTREVINLYHEVRDSLDTGVMDIHTIAIGDFENNSIYQGKFKKYDYELFRPALVHAIITDLSASTDLRIVDRQRTEKIVEETQLGAAGIVDPGSAVRAGKLLGAHCFVFGQYMILSKKNVRIDLRVVHTATGEIIVAKQITGEFSGKPEKFLEIEQQLVMEVAAAVDSVVKETTGKPSFLKAQAEEFFTAQAAEVKEKKDYPETQFLMGDAWQKEQEEDYASALETWKKVLDIDPDNRDAKRRVLILTSHVTG